MTEVVSYLSADNASVESLKEYSSFGEMMESFRTGRPLLVMVHGWEVDLKGYLKRVENVPELYGVDLLSFHWPSKLKNGGGPVQNFEYVRNRIDDMFPAFLKFTEELEGYLNHCSERCNIVFLSLANLFARKYAEALPEGRMSPFHNLMLNEACVPREGSSVWLSALSKKVSGGIFVTSNGYDHLLRLEERCFKRGMNLGHGPCPAELRSPDVRYFDVSEYYRHVLNPFFSHMFYLGPFNARRKPVFEYFRDVFTASITQSYCP